MGWIALAIVVATAIASAAYVAPKLLFLSLQAKVLETSAVQADQGPTQPWEQTGVADAGSYI